MGVHHPSLLLPGTPDLSASRMNVKVISNRLDIGGVAWRDHLQGGGGDTSMITFTSEKGPSDPVSCLFDCLFSTFWGTCLLSFAVIIINKLLCSLLLSHHYFIMLRRLFFLACPRRASVGST